MCGLNAMQAIAISLALRRLQEEIGAFAETNFAGRYGAALD
jgi:hypothetical protein